MWRRQRIFFLLPVLGIVFAAFTFYSNHFRFDNSVAVWLAYIPAGILFIGAMLLYRSRNFIQVTDNGVRIGRTFRTTAIAFDQIRAARVQPLERYFQDMGRRRHPPMVRALLPKPALYLRLRGDDARVAGIVRALGSQVAFADTIALPIPDPDAMAWEISSRLPERQTANLGGQRRRKRHR
jgi:hypothetical protein